MTNISIILDTVAGFIVRNNAKKFTQNCTSLQRSDIILKINSIYNDDCLIKMQEIDNESIDMIFCDLPYGTTQCKWDIIIPFEQLWYCYKRIIKPNGAIVLFSTQPFTSMLVTSNLPMFKYEWIYQKTQPSGHLNAKRMPMKYHENILVFYKKPPVYNPQKTTGHKRKVSKGQKVFKNEIGLGCYGAQEKGANYDSTERYPMDVITVSNGLMKQKSIHPTQKPLELCRYMIRTYTNPNDIVLDNCCGAGSIPLAAKIEGRNYIGIDNGVCEKQGKYYKWAWADVAIDRISTYHL